MIFPVNLLLDDVAYIYIYILSIVYSAKYGVVSKLQSYDLVISIKDNLLLD